MSDRQQRMIDRLLSEGALSGTQYAAAKQLRDLWEQAGLSVADLSAASLYRISGGQQEWVGDEHAFRRYTLAMRQMGRDGRRILFDIVISDMSPEVWGRRYHLDGLATLKEQLDRLAKWWGIEG